MIRFSKKKILISDDNQGFVMYLSILLKRMGFQVIPAESGLEAFRLSSMVIPDLFIVGIRIPEGEGLGVLKSIREDSATASIPVMVISNIRDEEKARQCTEFGCSAFLVKPLDIHELNDALQACLFGLTGDRRKSLRVQWNIEISLAHKGVSSVFPVQNISDRGIYLHCDKPLPVGSDANLVIPIDGDNPLNATARVIYVAEQMGTSMELSPGMALEFVDMSPTDRHRLSAFIQSLLISASEE